MFSKRALLLLLTILTGCSLRLNDPVTKTISNVNPGGGCLSKAGIVLDRYAKGILSAEEHDAFYGCVNKALATFVNYADGKNRDYFEPAELGGFLSRHFLNHKPIPAELLREAMALKVGIIGGSDTRISRDELRLTMDVFRNLQQLTGSLRSHMPLKIDTFLQRKYSPEQFEKALETFEQGVAEFGANLKAEQGSYSFDHLSGLFDKLAIFLYEEDVSDDHWTKFASRLAKALPPAKAIFISHPRDEIRPSDWSRIYLLAPRYFAAMLRVQYYTKTPLASTLRGGGLKTVERLFSEFVSNFDFVLEQHEGHVINSDEIDDFVITFHKQGLLPSHPDTARQFVKVLFGRLLGEAAASEKFTVTKESLSRFKRGARFMLEGLRAAEALYRLKHGDAFLEGKLTQDEIAAVPTALLIQATSGRDEIALEAVEALKRTPFEVRTVFSDDSFNVTIPLKNEAREFSYLNTIRMFGLRSLNRLLIEAYGEPHSNQLTEAQLSNFLNDIFPLMTELHFVDPGMRTSISKRLFEASMFLYSSDGDRGLTMNEALEMAALLLSTLENAPRIHNLIAANCAQEIIQKDIKGIALIPGPCYRREFLVHSKEVWSYLPGLAEYTERLSENDKADIFDRMDHFLRKAKTLSDSFSASDSQAFVLFSYYVELLFSRFDTNGDGKIDNAEANLAYPVFRPFIAEKAASKGLNNSKDHRAIFDFLLAYRVLPTEDKWSYLWRRYVVGSKPFQVDRSQVVEIFEKLLSL